MSVFYWLALNHHLPKVESLARIVQRSRQQSSGTIHSYFNKSMNIFRLLLDQSCSISRRLPWTHSELSCHSFKWKTAFSPLPECIYQTRNQSKNTCSSKCTLYYSHSRYKYNNSGCMLLPWYLRHLSVTNLIVHPDNWEPNYLVLIGSQLSGSRGSTVTYTLTFTHQVSICPASRTPALLHSQPSVFGYYKVGQSQHQNCIVVLQILLMVEK